MAVSTRNNLHLLAGNNDYRTVDLPGLLGIEENGDAWLGVFKSFDGGLTWSGTLLPGFPLDSSAVGKASPLELRVREVPVESRESSPISGSPGLL